MDASLKQIHEAIRNIQEAELQGDLVIACAPSIAGCWLLPLLSEFQREHPNISLHIRSGNDLISYENEENNADVAIYCGDSITDGCTRRRFCGTTCCPYALSIMRGSMI